MEKSIAIKCDEAEILELIKKTFDRDLESIVADQEIGNQDLVVNVDGEVDEWEAASVELWVSSGKGLFLTQPLLNVLCMDGVLEAGEYIIDCTW